MITEIQKNSAKEILIRTIRGERHSFHKSDVENSKFWYRIVTGCDQDCLITSTRSSETPEQKLQRIRLTRTLTPYAVGTVESEINQIKRTEPISNFINHSDENKGGKLRSKFHAFNEEKTLEQYLQDKIIFYNIIDPAAHLAIEQIRDKEGNAVKDVTPYPVEFTGEQSVNKCVENGKLKWLVACQNRVIKIEQTSNKKPEFGGTGQNNKVEKKEFECFDHYYYAAGIAVKATEYSKYDLPEKYEVVEFKSETPNQSKEQKRYFTFEYHDTKTTEIPVCPVGVYFSKKTWGKSYESVLEPARQIFRELIDSKSEFDLTRVLHIYLDKYRYGEDCNYIDPDTSESCVRGCLGGVIGNDCPACEGSGRYTPKTVQNEFVLPLPSDKDQFFPLSDLTHYAELPHETLEFIRRHSLETLPLLIFRAVFNPELIDPNVSQIANTATEVNITNDKKNNRIIPIADKVSRCFEKFVQIGAEYMGYSQGLNTSHKYPRDLGFESLAELQSTLKNAVEAGASRSIIERIEEKILKKIYVNDPSRIEQIKAMKCFEPFPDFDAPTVAAIAGGRSETDYDIILHYNKSRIFKEIEMELKENDLIFHELPYTRQKQIVQDKVTEIGLSITTNSAEPLQVGLPE